MVRYSDLGKGKIFFSKPFRLTVETTRPSVPWVLALFVRRRAAGVSSSTLIPI
jgi:hypothetical protein